MVNAKESHLENMTNKSMEKMLLKMDKYLRKNSTYDAAEKKFKLNIEPDKFVKVSVNGFPFAEGEFNTDGNTYKVQLYIGGKVDPMHSHCHCFYQKDGKPVRTKKTFFVVGSENNRIGKVSIDGPAEIKSSKTLERQPWDEEQV